MVSFLMCVSVCMHPTWSHVICSNCFLFERKMFETFCSNCNVFDMYFVRLMLFEWTIILTTGKAYCMCMYSVHTYLQTWFHNIHEKKTHGFFFFFWTWPFERPYSYSVDPFTAYKILSMLSNEKLVSHGPWYKILNNEQTKFMYI